MLFEFLEATGEVFLVLVYIGVEAKVIFSLNNASLRF
jgi:hypothetical protein